MRFITAHPMALIPLTLAFSACGGGPELITEVVDPWGNPVSGVEVSISGTDKALKTGGKGQVTVPLEAGSFRIKATKDEWIGQNAMTKVESTEESVTTKVTIAPQPPGKGYFLIGDDEDEYVAVRGEPIVRLGTDLRNFQGIRKTGDVEIELDDEQPFQVVFHSDLRRDQLGRLNIELHELTYQDEAKVLTVEGEQEVDLNLWISSQQIDLDRQHLSGGTWVFTAEKLQPGTYAFVTDDLFEDMTQVSFESHPKQARKAYPFVVE